jgi:hypothetical protein
MNWQELKETVYYWDGSWRDIYIFGTTREDWEKWVEYVNDNYKIDWYNGKTNKDESKIDFSVISDYWDGNPDLGSTANLYVGNLQINAHFFDSGEIENDIDPREFNNVEDHEKLIKYLTDLSKILSKQVILTPENEHETILLTVNGDQLAYSTNIDLSEWQVRTRK